MTMTLLKIMVHSIVATTMDSQGSSTDFSNLVSVNQTLLAMRYLIGNVLVFIICLGTSLNVIMSKRILAIQPPLVVTAWAYNIASVFYVAGDSLCHQLVES
jgi:hypothetical protein